MLVTPRSDRPRPAVANQYKTALSLGDLFRKRRDELKLTLDQVARDTKIRKQYLEQIEAGSYERLRDDIYTRGYVKNYADYLGLETAPILLLYRKERETRSKSLKLRGGKSPQKIGLTPIRSPRWIITPRSFVVLAIVGFLGLILVYLVWQFTGLAAAPHLVLENAGPQTVQSSTAYIAGHVNEGADVAINDSPILTDSSGNFREQVALVAGANEIRVTAKNHLGKVATVTKRFDAVLPKSVVAPVVTAPGAAGATPTVPAAPATFNGVQVVIHIRSGTSWIIVQADGVEIFRGTMLAGSKQTFQGANQLSISVGNAGVVDAVLTNTLVVSKDLGVLGAVGETKNNLVFDKSTNTL